MQTFLPYADYRQTAKCLDNKRLGKQRVECKQILLALGVHVGEHIAKESRWRNHPAVRMWRGYELELCRYSATMCLEWRRRGFNDSLLPQFVIANMEMYKQKTDMNPEKISNFKPVIPTWLGVEAVHASHRSNLLRKDSKHYGQFGWTEPDTLPYVWPEELTEIMHEQYQ